MGCTLVSVSILHGVRQEWSAPTGAAGGPLLERVLAARGIAPADRGKFLSPAASDLSPAGQCPGAQAAAEVILGACDDGKPLLVWGDYDLDGLSAAAILRHALALVRPRARVQCHVPLRSDGYGLSAATLEREIAAIGSPSGLLVTVDCGISAHRELDRARELGWECVVIDHHVMHEGPPTGIARAVVHWDLPVPGGEQEGGQHGGIEMCAAALAWKVACCIAERSAGGRPAAETVQLLCDLLPLAGMATVADVMPLLGENRLIAKVGLAFLPRSRVPAAAAIARHCHAKSGHDLIGAENVGFQVGPKLNALGRMGSAAPVLAFLCRQVGEPGADDASMDRELEEFEKVNEQRKEVEARIVAEALEQARAQLRERGEATGLCLHGKGWHHGVGGIVASRLAEALRCPAFVLSWDEVSGVWRGSGRNAGRVDLALALSQCRAEGISGGGHRAAAGVTVAPDRLERFKEAFRAACEGQLRTEAPPDPHRIDAIVTLADLDRKRAEELHRAGPFGRGFPAPRLLCRGVRVDSIELPSATQGGGSRKRSDWMRLHLSQRCGGTWPVRARAMAWRADDLRDVVAAGGTYDMILTAGPGQRDYLDVAVQDVVVQGGRSPARDEQR